LPTSSRQPIGRSIVPRQTGATVSSMRVACPMISKVGSFAPIRKSRATSPPRPKTPFFVIPKRHRLPIISLERLHSPVPGHVHHAVHVGTVDSGGSLRSTAVDPESRATRPGADRSRRRHGHGHDHAALRYADARSRRRRLQAAGAAAQTYIDRGPELARVSKARLTN
jgi:hypothetical protein